jgi:hypothetical protein
MLHKNFFVLLFMKALNKINDYLQGRMHII